MKLKCISSMRGRKSPFMAGSSYSFDVGCDGEPLTVYPDCNDRYGWIVDEIHGEKFAVYSECSNHYSGLIAVFVKVD